MKKILMILLACFALASCGDGAKNSEANRDDNGYENTDPNVTDDNTMDDNSTTDDGTMSDTTNTTLGDTTATAPQATPAP